MEQARELAQQFMAGRAEEVGTGDKRREEGGVWSAAAKLLGGHGQQGHGEVAEEAGVGDKQPHTSQMDEGFVDTLLDMFKSSEGKQFEGHEHEYDKLAGMAQNLLGTDSIQRDLLKAWVKQRLGA